MIGRLSTECFQKIEAPFSLWFALKRLSNTHFLHRLFGSVKGQADENLNDG